MNIILKLEGIIGSAPIDVLAEMLEFSRKLKITVSCDMNEIYMIVSPHNHLSDLLREYEKRLQHKGL